MLNEHELMVVERKIHITISKGVKRKKRGEREREREDEKGNVVALPIVINVIDKWCFMIIFAKLNGRKINIILWHLKYHTVFVKQKMI